MLDPWISSDWLWSFLSYCSIFRSFIALGSNRISNCWSCFLVRSFAYGFLPPSTSITNLLHSSIACIYDLLSPLSTLQIFISTPKFGPSLQGFNFSFLQNDIPRSEIKYLTFWTLGFLKADFSYEREWSFALLSPCLEFHWCYTVVNLSQHRCPSAKSFSLKISF